MHAQLVDLFLGAEVAHGLAVDLEVQPDSADWRRISEFDLGEEIDASAP